MASLSKRLVNVTNNDVSDAPAFDTSFDEESVTDGPVTVSKCRKTSRDVSIQSGPRCSVVLVNFILFLFLECISSLFLCCDCRTLFRFILCFHLPVVRDEMCMNTISRFVGSGI